MNGPSSLPIPPGSDLSEYEVGSRFEIVSILRQIAETHALVTISFREGRESIVSALLGVNPEFEELVIDCGTDKDANAHLLASPRLQVSTFLDHIRIQFVAGGVQATMFQGKPAFRIRLPEKLLRLQRRNFFRVKLPMSSGAICHVTHPTCPKVVLKLRMTDLSCGGLAVLASPVDFDPAEGDVIPDCRIALPDFGEFKSALEVRNVTVLVENAATKVKRYGCRFVDLAGPTAALVQRYILFVERSRLAAR
jgi:c-di-GMP-binding flagellar brake protein YcgR